MIILKLRSKVHHCCKTFCTDSHVKQVPPVRKYEAFTVVVIKNLFIQCKTWQIWASPHINVKVFKRLFRQVSVTDGKTVSTKVSIHLRQ